MDEGGVKMRGNIHFWYDNDICLSSMHINEMSCWHIGDVLRKGCMSWETWPLRVGGDKNVFSFRSFQASSLPLIIYLVTYIQADMYLCLQLNNKPCNGVNPEQSYHDHDKQFKKPHFVKCQYKKEQFVA